MEEQNKVNIEVVSIDDHNFNKGNEQGAQLLERSFRECGAGRSVRDPTKVNDLYEDINVKKSIKQFNEQRTISDKHSKILVFFKGDTDNIRLDFEETTPPDPTWEDIAIFTEKNE